MSRYHGNDESCPCCGETYGRFRTGMRWGDVLELFWTPADASPVEGTVTGVLRLELLRVREAAEAYDRARKPEVPR